MKKTKRALLMIIQDYGSLIGVTESSKPKCNMLMVNKKVFICVCGKMVVLHK